MSAYKCANCSETMFSKCPDARTVFPENQKVTAFGNTLILKVQPYTNKSEAKCLSLEWGCYNENTSAEEMFAHMVETIRNFTDEELEILVCKHDWYLPEGETCSLEGHEHTPRNGYPQSKNS